MRAPLVDTSEEPERLEPIDRCRGEIVARPTLDLGLAKVRPDAFCPRRDGGRLPSERVRVDSEVDFPHAARVRPTLLRESDASVPI